MLRLLITAFRLPNKVSLCRQTTHHSYHLQCLNERASARFSQDPKKYLEEKLMVGLFRRVWTTVVPKNLQAPVEAMTQEMVARQDQDEISNQQWHHKMMNSDIQRYFAPRFHIFSLK